MPVIVGEDRYAAGQFAEEKFGPQAHLLDDGFQHRRLARDFDIVLVTERDLHDSLLPIGKIARAAGRRWREPQRLFSCDGELRHRFRARKASIVWRVPRGIVSPETNDLCFAFCGIARPKNFFAELRKAGVRVVGTREFRDHHAYSGDGH